jgi:hypothetical protein
LVTQSEVARTLGVSVMTLTSVAQSAACIRGESGPSDARLARPNR